MGRKGAEPVLNGSLFETSWWRRMVREFGDTRPRLHARHPCWFWPEWGFLREEASSLNEWSTGDNLMPEVARQLLLDSPDRPCQLTIPRMTSFQRKKTEESIFLHYWRYRRKYRGGVGRRKAEDQAAEKMRIFLPEYRGRPSEKPPSRPTVKRLLTRVAVHFMETIWACDAQGIEVPKSVAQFDRKKEVEVFLTKRWWQERLELIEKARRIAASIDIEGNSVLDGAQDERRRPSSVRTPGRPVDTGTQSGGPSPNDETKDLSDGSGCQAGGTPTTASP